MCTQGTQGIYVGLVGALVANPSQIKSDFHQGQIALTMGPWMGFLLALGRS